MSIGMLVHEASVLVVTANAMRLLRHHTPKSHASRITRAADRAANAASIERYIPREVVRLPRRV
jgi:Cd2+/Zn2+-exporting ATPase